MFCKTPHIIWHLLLMTFSHASVGQQYFTNSEGEANIHFLVSGELATATTNQVEIIYNEKTETVWITFQVESFQMEIKKLRKKLFKKNVAKFTLRGEVSFDHIINTDFGFGQFSFIGRIFNDHDTSPVVASGRVSLSQEKENHGYQFSISCGIGTKWFGQKFLDRSGFPAVNIHVTNTILSPVPAQSKLTKNRFF